MKSKENPCPIKTAVEVARTKSILRERIPRKTLPPSMGKAGMRLKIASIMFIPMSLVNNSCKESAEKFHKACSEILSVLNCGEVLNDIAKCIENIVYHKNPFYEPLLAFFLVGQQHGLRYHSLKKQWTNPDLEDSLCHG
jgi:hypothetical protein